MTRYPFRGKIYAFFAKVYEIIYKVARRSWEILYRGIHWLGGLLYRGSHWLGGLLYRGSHYAYWMLHRIWRFFYWKYYYTSRKLYQEIIKNAWCDVFFVYLRKYLKAIPVNFSGYNIVSTRSSVKYVFLRFLNIRWKGLKNIARRIFIWHWYPMSRLLVDPMS